MSRQPYGGGFSLGGSLSTVVRMLVAWNVIIFLVQLLAGRFVRGLDVWLVYNLGLVPREVFHGHVWQLVSYMFLHGSFFHVLFNMIALWMFGSELENLWGSRRFLYYYFFTGIGAGITNAVFTPNAAYPIIGASGAVFGILLAFALYFPNRPILLWFFIPMKAKYFVMIFGAIEFFASIQPGRSGIAHLAHLGGLVFGFLYLRVIPWGRLKGRGRRRRNVYDIRDYRDRDG